MQGEKYIKERKAFKSELEKLRSTTEGNRNNQLNESVLKISRFIGKGITESEIISAFRNTALQTGLSEAETMGTIRSALNKGRQNITNDNNKEPLLPLFTRQDSAISMDWFDKEPPEQEFLLKGFLPKNIVAFLLATGGVGKSQLALQLAISVACGRALLSGNGNFTPGIEVTEIGEVIYLSAEDDRNEVHRRVKRICEFLKLNDNEKAAVVKNFHVVELVGKKTYLTKKQGNECIITDVQIQLIEALKNYHNVKLIIVDTGARFRGGQENDNDDATRFIIAIEEIRLATGATILCLHHSPKQNAGQAPKGIESARGASALLDGARHAMQLSVKPPQVRAKLNQHLTLDVVKTNYTAFGKSYDIERNENGVLFESFFNDSKAEKRTKDKEAIKTLIQKEAKKNNEYSKASFVKAFATELKLGEVSLRNLLNDMIKQHSLIETKPKTKKKNVRLVVALPAE